MVLLTLSTTLVSQSCDNADGFTYFERRISVSILRILMVLLILSATLVSQSCDNTDGFTYFERHISYMIIP